MEVHGLNYTKTSGVNCCEKFEMNFNYFESKNIKKHNKVFIISI